ncbi:hypothetical protein V8E53_010044 [Lactarius tabidus]
MAYFHEVEEFDNVFYINAAGQPIVVLNAQKIAVNLLDRHAGIYYTYPCSIVAAQILCGGSVIVFHTIRESSQIQIQVFDQHRSKRSDQYFLRSVSITVGDILNLSQGGSGIPSLPISYPPHSGPHSEPRTPTWTRRPNHTPKPYSRSPRKAKISRGSQHLQQLDLAHSSNDLRVLPSTAITRPYQAAAAVPSRRLPRVVAAMSFSAWVTPPPFTAVSCPANPQSSSRNTLLSAQSTSMRIRRSSP